MSVCFFFPLSLFLWTTFSFLFFLLCLFFEEWWRHKIDITLHRHHSFLSLKHQNALLSLSLFRRRRRKRRRCLDWENSTKRSGTPRRCAFLSLFLFLFLFLRVILSRSSKTQLVEDASSFSSLRELQISDTIIKTHPPRIVSLTTPSRTDTRPKR